MGPLEGSCSISFTVNRSVAQSWTPLFHEASFLTTSVLTQWLRVAVPCQVGHSVLAVLHVSMSACNVAEGQSCCHGAS